MITVTLNLDLDCTKEIEWYVKSKLPELINEKLFENPQELNKLIKNAVDGQFRQVVNEILQSNDFRSYMKEKVIAILKEGEKQC